MKCRHCNNTKLSSFVNLGNSPISNDYLGIEQLNKPEIYYPLQVKVCGKCWLVQTEDFIQPKELFRNDYAYFSSVSSSWCNHASKYVDKITTKLKLNERSLVLEIASNDGYLLKNFVQKQIPCIGIEPTKSTANEAKKHGVKSIEEFFTAKFAATFCTEYKKVDLVIANNVLAHVPDINDFCRGIEIVLADNGVATIEFPHFLNLLEKIQFDTIYHEHYSYLSLVCVNKIFQKSGLRIFDVEKIKTHGGSLRVYACKKDGCYKTKPSVNKVLQSEVKRGLTDLHTYDGFQINVNYIKYQLLRFLLKQRLTNKLVIGYGAAAKGNTLLNYCGIKSDLVSKICDKSDFKLGKFAPGSQIPIVHPEIITKIRPHYIIVFPWNLISEIKSELSYVKEWNCKFVTCIPKLKIH